MTEPTEYSYFLDGDGNVWRQAPGSGLYEINDSGLWHVAYPDRPLVLRLLTLSPPTRSHYEAGESK